MIDVGFHIGVTDLHTGGTLEDLAKLPDEGVTSYKLFMAYKGAVMVDDDTLFRTMLNAADSGALVMVHAENGDAIDLIVKKAVAEGKTEPIWHARTRPMETEAEATNRAVQLSRVAGCPLYVVHVSCQPAVEPIQLAREKGWDVWGETCTQYLFIDESALDQPGFEGGKYIYTPPPRPKEHQEHLWKALQSDALSAVSTDHCPFNWPEQKGINGQEFQVVPNGGPGIENRLHMLHHFGVREGRITLNRFVELTSTNIAKLFGLYPRKGTIAPGSDADIVVWDPEKELTISAETNHSNVNYNLFEGTQGPRSARGRARARPGDRRGRRARRAAGRRPVREARPLRRGADATGEGGGVAVSDEQAREVYAKARLGESITMGSRPAVLVVDFSCGFTDPDCALGSDLTAEVEATKRLLDAAREKGLPVIFTTIGFEESLKDGGLWLQKVPSLGDLQLGGRWVEIDPRLERRPEETVIVKKVASAFFGTNLASVLISQGIDSVILCGATTSGCIRATAIDLLQYGFPTLVPRECVGDRAQAPHEANLFDIQAKYADVVPLEEALAYVESVLVGGRRARVTHRIAVLPGDGVGPEVVAEARKAVDALGLPVAWTELPWGSAWYREHGRMMPEDALDTLRDHDAVLLGRDRAIPRCPITSRSGTRSSRSARGSTCGRTFVLAACCRGSRLRSRAAARRRGLPRRAREHRGRVRRGRRPLAPRARLRGRAGDERLHAGRRAARRALRLRAGGFAPRDADERDEVERVAVRLRALGRGGRGDGGGVRRRPRRAGARGRARRAHGARSRQASTSSSPRISSATSSPTSRRRSRAAWAWRRARTSPPAPTRRASSSPCTARRLTSPGKGSPIPWVRSGALR